MVGKPLCVSSGTSLRLRTTRCHPFPANMQHWHIRASYIPTKENRGIHLCLTILRFESIEKIGASRRRASIPPPTGFYGESKDLSSQSIIVFAHNIFIEPLDDCRHAKTTIASTKRPTQKSSAIRQVNTERFVSFRLLDPSVHAIGIVLVGSSCFVVLAPFVWPKSVFTRQSPQTRGRS